MPHIGHAMQHPVRICRGRSGIACFACAPPTDPPFADGDRRMHARPASRPVPSPFPASGVDVGRPAAPVAADQPCSHRERVDHKEHANANDHFGFGNLERHGAIIIATRADALPSSAVLPLRLGPSLVDGAVRVVHRRTM